jgi:hypothetical protein
MSAGRRNFREAVAAAGGSFLFALVLTATWIPPASAANDNLLTARTILEEAFRRHEMFPYVFEEQTLILIDRYGRRDMREVRRFSRISADGTVRFLLTFDNPPEIRGVAMLVVDNPTGEKSARVYLPANGERILRLRGEGGDFLGTDFSVADLIPERLSDHRYERREDQKVGEIDCFVIDAFPDGATANSITGCAFRRHFVRQDIFFIIRTDYHDRQGRLFKSQSRHDLKHLGKEMWSPNMILMKNLLNPHQTLIKIHRRVFSQAYVPLEIFTASWLLENRHISWPDRRLFLQPSDLGEESPGTGTTRERSDFEPAPPSGPAAREVGP